MPQTQPLHVVAQDPRFGGGGSAQVDAFLMGARELGRLPTLHWVEHPTLAGRRLTPDRVEVVRQARGASRLARQLGTGDLWAVTTIATNAYAAARSGRTYRCWIGTSLDDEWSARSRGLDPPRRLAQHLNAPVLRRFERRTLRGAERLYATSPASRAAVSAAAGVPEHAVGILPIPVDVERFSPEPDVRWRQRLGAPTIVFVGRADDPRKNAALLLEAWPLIRARRPLARLRFVGRPPVRLPDGAEALGEVASVADALRDATLFVLPSWQEGFGVVAAEALAAGVPVVSTPCGGPEELVNASGGGRVLGSFAPDELAEVVTELLGDADILSTMRSRGREYVVREHSTARFRELLAAALE